MRNKILSFIGLLFLSANLYSATVDLSVFDITDKSSGSENEFISNLLDDLNSDYDSTLSQQVFDELVANLDSQIHTFNKNNKVFEFSLNQPVNFVSFILTDFGDKKDDNTLKISLFNQDSVVKEEITIFEDVNQDDKNYEQKNMQFINVFSDELFDRFYLEKTEGSTGDWVGATEVFSQNILVSSPVPEAPTYLMMILGLATLLFWQSKQSRSN
jgi:hypothetical protein